MIDKRMKAARM